MIEKLLPEGVASVETFTDPPDALLHPDEEEFVARAVPKRRHEFATGRWCARQALTRLGVTPTALPRGERGKPQWPADITGSITHCSGYRAAAVAARDRFVGIGIDAEPHEPLPEGVLHVIASSGERDSLPAPGGAEPAPHLDRVLFSAKESIFKAWYPVTHRWLEFEDAEIQLDADSFSARLSISDPTGEVPDTVTGRWLVADGLVLTAVVLTGRQRDSGRTST